MEPHGSISNVETNTSIKLSDRLSNVSECSKSVSSSSRIQPQTEMNAVMIHAASLEEAMLYIAEWLRSRKEQFCNKIEISAANSSGAECWDHGNVSEAHSDVMVSYF